MTPESRSPRSSQRWNELENWSSSRVPESRKPILFWHFWGGADRAVVDFVVARFNASQDEHWVRAVAMPGNNLDMKLFLAITGGQPPDVVNQDDPILGDWAERSALLPIGEVASSTELHEVEQWLLPAARELGSYRGQLYGLCNGLDVRALYFNRSVLDEFGMEPPQTILQLDHIAETITPVADSYERFAFLPNPKFFWSWGIVFGGQFFDSTTKRITLTNYRTAAALAWMASYGQRYGDAALAFRTGDQSLPGQVFPLLAGRYVLIVDGQWRVRDIMAAQESQRRRGEEVTQYGVTSLPHPPGGRENAGWINGNFFVIPQGAANPQGAWQFMRYWTGMTNAAVAAEACAAGGWIPVSQRVIDQPVFQQFLQESPLFVPFVKLASSPHQVPRPNIVGAPYLDRELKAVASAAMYQTTGRAEIEELLNQSQQKVETYLQAGRSRFPPTNARVTPTPNG